MKTPSSSTAALKLPIQPLQATTSRDLLIVFLSGMVMSCTVAPVGAWILAWIAIIPLWSLITRHRSRPFLLGLTWGIGYHGFTLAWLRDLHPLTWLGVPWLASILIMVTCWILVTCWGALRTALWGWALSKVSQRQLGDSAIARLLWGIMLWAGLETLWSYSILSWTSLALTQSPQNLVILHLGQLSGPTTVVVAIALCNGLLAEAWNHRHKRFSRSLVTIACSFFISIHLIGYALYSQPLADRPEAALKVGIIQGNIPTRIKHADQGERKALNHYTTGYEDLVQAGAEAVLTPEGTFPWLWINTPAQEANPLYQSIQAWKVPAWIGTVGLDTVKQGASKLGKVTREHITQSLFTITGTGELFSRYDKIKLVPLGEYIPFQDVLGSVISRLSPVEASLYPGDPEQVFETPFGRAIAAICFDSAFPEIFRHQAAAGGQFILTAANNDPYGHAMMAQHHAQDVLRAIEGDRWAARATNTGYSAIIDPHGKTQWLSDFRTFQTHLHTIYRRQAQTLYVRWGDWILLVLIIGCIGLSVVKQAMVSRNLEL